MFKGLRIGYVPASDSFLAPADRRRFIFYAKKRNIKFEVAKPSNTYDLVILTQRADLSVWNKYPKGKTKIIYESTDSYFAVPRSNIKGKLRGLSKYLTGQHRYLQFNYKKSIENMYYLADAVICSTELQKKMILPFCPNVHVILDFQDNDINMVKTDYSNNFGFNFVWEGLASSGIPLKILRDILEPFYNRQRIALHLITDIIYYRYHNLYRKCHTFEEIKRIFKTDSQEVYLYQWNNRMFSKISCACDLALIPIPLNDPFQAGKPENKLILFWRMGIPTLASATPAYERVMQKSSLPMSCKTISEWHIAIDKYMRDENARKHAGETAKRFAENNYGEDVTLKRWDDLLYSL